MQDRKSHFLGDLIIRCGYTPHGLKNLLCDSTGGECSGHACPRVGPAADAAALMRIVMAELAELISADSILIKLHLYPWESNISMCKLLL
jgi:hypothetical protein